MKAKAPPPAATLNREIIDDRDGRLSIHTQEIRLTQAHLPYQPVEGKRLPSTKHFAVFADRIVLDGVLQNPGRNIELNAREIVIEKPATLDVGGAYADKDFAAGEPAIQKDAKPGTAGTDGTEGTVGGNGGSIVVNARVVSNKIGAARPLSVTELAGLGARVFSEHPPKVEDTSALGRFELGKIKIYGDYEMAVALDDARIEGLAKLSAESARVDGSRVAMRLDLPALSLTGVESGRRIASQNFGCKIDASAMLGTDGKIGAIEAELSLISGSPISVPLRSAPGKLSDAGLETIRKKIAAHLQAAAVEPLLKGVGEAIRKSALTLLAGGGRGGRGQDGHAGVQGEAGEDGAKTSKSGVDTGSGYGFPEEAIGKGGHKGGQAGSPGPSGNGGNGGRIELNVIDPVAADIVYDIGGGDGGGEARPGARGAGGPGGRGSVCKMFHQKTGRPSEDQKAPDGPTGPEGPAAKRGGKKGEAGSAGAKLQLNGKAFAAGQAPSLSFAALAQTLSLSQLLIAQNAADMDFLNAKTEDELAAVAASYSWLVDINQPFTGAATGIDPARVSALEQKVRGGIHNSAMVSLMRLEQGLDFYGHTYNWTPVLNLKYLAKRTGDIITIGEVIQEQYEKYLAKGETDANRMEAFKKAKEKIDTKVKDFNQEIGKIAEQIENFRTEIADCSEDIVLQRKVLLEGQLKFKDELIKHLRKESELGLADFLDILGTVVGALGGVAGGAGGIKTAIDKVKKAEEFKNQVKGVVEVFKKAKATIDGIKKAYSAVKDLIDGENPNAAKIVVDGTELDEMLKKYLDKFDAAGELRKALDHYVKLCQTRNMAAYNYTTQVAQLLTTQAQRDQLHSGIQHINAEMAAHKNNVLPIYTAYLRDAYEDVQRDLLRNIYLENRAYQYWSLKERQLETENLNVATLAATHERLMKAIDSFREENEEFGDFRQIVKISASRYPTEFAALPVTKSLAFTLDIRNKDFENMSYIIARSFKLVFPDIVFDPEELEELGEDEKRVLSVNLIHSGQALLNSNTKLDRAGALHLFSHRPRVRLHKIDYKTSTNTAGGSLGDNAQGYIGLSPFTMWRIDFDLDGNDWLDLKIIKTVQLTFEGRMLGPGRKPPGTPL